MNTDEYQNLYHQIEEIINNYRLGWIIEQVNNSIYEGKIVSIEDRLAKKNREKPHRIKREDYTEKEKLILLLDAFETAIVNTIELEQAIGNFLTEEINDSTLEPQIKFCSEDEENIHYLTFNPETTKLRQQQAKELQKLLNNLRQEIEE